MFEFWILAMVVLFVFNVYSCIMNMVAEKGAISGANSVEGGAKKKIDALVAKMAKIGFMVHHREDEQIQLKRKKSFSFFAALSWFLLFGVGLIIYLIYYMSKRDTMRTFTYAEDEGLVVS